MSLSLKAIEEPSFTLLEQQDNWQLRHYESFNIAKVYIKGDENKAGNNGFKPLANYIFGGNKQAKSIPMTAPVMQKQIDNNVYEIAFVMPKEIVEDDLPTPIDQQVTIENIPSTHYLVLEFSGRWDAQRWKNKAQDLQQVAKQRNWQVIGSPIYARYNPPWIPVFFRRNEILIPVTL